MDYVSIPGVDGRYFQCAPLRALLSVSSCSGRFTAANHESVCHGCSVGAQHAGKTVVSRRAVPRLLCCRCHDLAPRLINGGICVSCYNREREVAAGRNAKGTAPHPHESYWTQRAPGKTLRLHRIEIGLLRGKARRVVHDRAADTIEVVLGVLRSNGDAAFWRRPPCCAVHSSQQSLFAGV